MMTAEDLKIARLRENPFRLEPAERVTLWAGDHDLEKRLLAIIKSVRNDVVGLSEFVVLHGELGTGKSHALRYLQAKIEAGAEEYRSPCVYLPTLRLAERVAFLDVYRKIIGEIGRERIEELGAQLISRVEREYVELREKTPASDFKVGGAKGAASVEQRLRRDAQERVLGRAWSKYGLFEKLASRDDGAWFYIGASRERLDKKLLASSGATSPIVSDFEAVSHLAMIVNLACEVSIGATGALWKAFYLFVDESEAIAEIEPRAALSLNHAFRDLLNACPEHLCLMFGATADAALVETALAPALLDRMTKSPITLPALDDTQAEAFMKEILGLYRVAGDGDDWHPFTEEAARFIIAETTNKTPRNLFRSFRQVLDNAANASALKKAKKIKKTDAEQFLV